jgi:murein DD-endopeptidase MepM/ murein hydrolase activator NlpD
MHVASQNVENNWGDGASCGVGLRDCISFADLTTLVQVNEGTPEQQDAEAAQASASTQAAAAASTATGSVTILGQTVTYTNAAGNAGARIDALLALTDAVSAINTAQSQLTPDQISDIHAVTAVYMMPSTPNLAANAGGFSVTNAAWQRNTSDVYGISAPIGSFVINAPNFSGASSGFAGSMFLHEGVHIIRNRDPASTPAAEQRAYAAQYGAASAFHLRTNEVRFLQGKCGASCQ